MYGLPAADVSEEQRVQKPAEVGEGGHRLSWIWSTGLDVEGLDDPMTRKDKLHLTPTSPTLTSDFFHSTLCRVG